MRVLIGLMMGLLFIIVLGAAIVIAVFPASIPLASTIIIAGCSCYRHLNKKLD